MNARCASRYHSSHPLVLPHALLALAALLCVAACGGESSEPSDAGDASSDASFVADAAPDAPVDASEDACISPAPVCIGPCALRFFNVDPLRPNVLSLSIENSVGAPMNILDVRVTSPSDKVRLADSWFVYMERAGENTWVPSEDRRAFDTPGTPIPVQVDESFTVDVVFDEHPDGTGCPDDPSGACGTLEIDVAGCLGQAIVISADIQR